MIKELLGAKLSKKEFQTHVNDMHAYDIANELLELSDAERAIFFDALTTDQLADIFAYLEPDLAADFLSSFTSEKQTKILDELIVDDAVDILQSYDDPSLRDEVITTLEEAHIIKDIIKYDDDTVGAYISNDYVSINPRMDVKEASTSLIKQAPEAETINLLFVVDENNQYLGAVNLKTLVKARSPKLISEIMETIPAVSANSPITEAIYDMKNYELYELPGLSPYNCVKRK